MHLAGVHLRTGATVSVAAEEPVTAASIIKLPVLVHVLQAVDAGTLTLDRVGPLLQPMIAVSSNEATNELLDLVGLSAVQQTVETLGMRSTRIRRRMMDLDARAAGRENVTTAADVLTLLRGLAAGTLLAATTQAFALDALLAQVFTRLPVPTGLRFAHKTGELAGVRHDAGILLEAADDAPSGSVPEVGTAAGRGGAVAVAVALLSGLDLRDDDDTPPALFVPAADLLWSGLGL